MTSTIRSRSTISPMTIVVVREEPAGDSDAAAFGVAAVAALAVAGFGDSTVAGAGETVEGAPAVAAAAGAVAASAVFGAAVGLAVDCASAADETRARARRRAEIAARGFMTSETIGRTPKRQAPKALG
jgi:hypothetical protein